MDKNDDNIRLGVQLRSQYDWIPVPNREDDYQDLLLANEHTINAADCLSHIIVEPQSCTTSAFVFLAINSHARHYNRRKGIRKSWAKMSNRFHVSNQTWKAVFIVGLTGVHQVDVLVNNEASYYGDMLITNLIEDHSNLTSKTVTGMLWAYKHCNPQFYYKVDDDVWLNKWRIYDYLWHLSKKGLKIYDNHWIGFVSTYNRIPIRTNSSKYYLSMKEYKWRRFPPYCSGFANLMSGKVLKKLIDVMDSIPMLPGVDDVYVGLLAYKVGVKPKHDHRFRMEKPASSYESEIDQIFALHGIRLVSLQTRLNELARLAYTRNMNKRYRRYNNTT